MARLPNSVKGSLAGRTFSRFLRFGVLRGLRSIEINPTPSASSREQARLVGSDFARMKDVPWSAWTPLRGADSDAERLALAEGRDSASAHDYVFAGCQPSHHHHAAAHPTPLSAYG